MGVIYSPFIYNAAGPDDQKPLIGVLKIIRLFSCEAAYIAHTYESTITAEDKTEILLLLFLSLLVSSFKTFIYLKECMTTKNQNYNILNQNHHHGKPKPQPGLNHNHI
jgi:hypothetical protein